MKDSDWRILYELYKNPSVTSVANVMFKTQSAISKRLQRIEDEFDVQIVERTPYGFKFTPEGEYLGKKAGEYFDFVDVLNQQLYQISSDRKDTIKIGSSFIFAKYSLQQILNNFTEYNPKADSKVVIKQSNNLYEDLLNSKLDVCFVTTDYRGRVFAQPITDGIWMIYRKQKRKSTVVESFLKFMDDKVIGKDVL